MENKLKAKNDVRLHFVFHLLATVENEVAKNMLRVVSACLADLEKPFAQRRVFAEDELHGVSICQDALDLAMVSFDLGWLVDEKGGLIVVSLSRPDDGKIINRRPVRMFGPQDRALVERQQDAMVAKMMGK